MRSRVAHRRIRTHESSVFPDPIEGARWIPLTRGKFALVDEEDFSRLSEWIWYFHKDSKTKSGYAVGANKNLKMRDQRRRQMHQVILNVFDGVIDHRDRNGLNNRKSNLRICSHSQNHLNTGLNSNSSSGFKGVSWDKNRGQWACYVRIDGKRKYLGRYSSAQEAAMAYDYYVKSASPVFACTNTDLGLL